MGCTIDHLRVDHCLEIIADFADARGVLHRAGESGILRQMQLDWPRQEIVIEWERENAREKMVFSLAAKQGPRNGAMREFFALGEYSPAARPGARTSSVNLASHDAGPTIDSSREVTAKQVNDTPADERAVKCRCDPGLYRAVLVEPRNVHVTACLRCHTLSCTRMVGDDGRFHGNAWHAYVPADVSAAIVDWLALWPRVRVTYAKSRWPMSGTLVRRDYLYYPRTTRVQNSAELAELEERLIQEQGRKTLADRLRDQDWPKTPPPKGMPEDLRGFVEVWEALRLRADSELSKLVYLAQPLSQASHIAVDLLRQRPDAFEVMTRGLRSDDPLWQDVGHAMARDFQPGDPHLADVIIEVFQGLSFAPLPDVPDRIVSCGRFEALLLLIADLKLGSPKMLTALKGIQRRLIRHDSSLVKYINIVVQELVSKA